MSKSHQTKNRKFCSAQISAEFFILLGISLLIAIAFGIMSLAQLKEFREQKESDMIKDLALMLQKELFVAASVEDGYIRTFKIPNELETVNYSITTSNTTVFVQSEIGFYAVTIPTIIGNVSKGINIINKSNGVIYVSH